MLALSMAAVGTCLPIATASAQTTSAQQQDQQSKKKDQQETVLQEVVVTGSILRQTGTETPSPISIISSDTLADRGITTVATAMQRVSANNAGTITSSWSNWGFTTGATAPSLRGLTVQDTLSIADGQRLAPYPLADDGVRNFVDLSTIPNAIIDRIEVLRDGASSTYGADAIAGVVNVITKKEIKGLHLGASWGDSQQGGGAEKHFDATWGMGDLASQGYNFYISGEYQKNDIVWARDRGYPINTSDWSHICGPTGSCGPNYINNSVNAEDGSFNGFYSVPGVTFVRSVTPGETSGSGRWEYVNPDAGCRNWTTVNLDPSIPTSSPLVTCAYDTVAAYAMLEPQITRMGLSSRFTANIGDDAQFYAMANWYKTDTWTSITPTNFYGRPTPPYPDGLPNYYPIQPVYVCSQGVGTFDGTNTGCDATNGQLNPYNPYAADGLNAQTLMRSPWPRITTIDSRALRFATGIDGSFAGDWNYSANFTASEVGLTQSRYNNPIPQRIMDVTAQGTFNWADPLATPQDVLDYVMPPNINYSVSRLWQISGNIGRNLMDLPGGPLQAAVGASYRDEMIDSPSANPANDSAPWTRYFSINAVGVNGSRNVTSGYFEIDAPVLEQLDLTASGRYDDYSSGQTNFSPKVGFKWTPIEMIGFRGTFSKGFRIPSFNEAYGLPTTGYQTANGVDCATYPDFCAAHASNPGYTSGPYSYGVTSTGNPSLNPEKSTSWTAGLILKPINDLLLTVDYWQIEVKGLIASVTDTSEALDQYYSNNGVVNIPGITVLPGNPDLSNPNALPVIGFIQASFSNQDKEEVKGLDFGANYVHEFGPVRWTSSLEASYLIKYSLTQKNGVTLRYDGTLSPCNITSCSGSPKWRGTWQNTADYGPFTATLTMYYTKGYDMAEIDYAGVRGDCNNQGYIQTNYVDGTPMLCHSKDIYYGDLTLRYHYNDQITVNADVRNVFNQTPPFDPSAAYGIFGYNPAWADALAMGRWFRIGVKYDFE